MGEIVKFFLGDGFGKVLDKFFPDAAQKAQVQLELLKMQQAGEFKELDTLLQTNLAQVEVNKIEAASPSFWKSGARPAVLWVCVLALVYDFLTQPLLSWASLAFWHCAIPPQLDISTLTTLLVGLLGISTQRSVERVMGKS